MGGRVEKKINKKQGPYAEHNVFLGMRLTTFICLRNSGGSGPISAALQMWQIKAPSDRSDLDEATP